MCMRPLDPVVGLANLNVSSIKVKSEVLKAVSFHLIRKYFVVVIKIFSRQHQIANLNTITHLDYIVREKCKS